MKVLKALSQEQQARLVVMNLAFLLMFLFHYSALSLLSLFIGWVVISGITLHLIFLATSEDDYHSKFKESKADRVGNQSAK